MPVSPVIEVAQLSVTHGKFHPVEEISTRVARRELYALFGTNGAGRTSTLEVIEGRRTTSAGTVRVFGKCPTARRTVRPRMGILRQESGFAADRTVAGVSGNGRRQPRAEV
jgi:ABC-2 type transport system ATP-binding protein